MRKLSGRSCCGRRWACRQSRPTSRHSSSGRSTPGRPLDFEARTAAFREGVTERAGRAGRRSRRGDVLLRAQTRASTDAVPLGLAGGVVFHPEALRARDGARSREARTNVIWGGKRWKGAWCSAGVQRPPKLFGRCAAGTQGASSELVLQRADEILREVQADAYAYLSDISFLGFDQRLARFGERLSEMLEPIRRGGKWMR